MAGSRTGLTEGRVIASAVLLIAATFAYRQWAERARRSVELSEADRAHFARKDRRRLLGSFLMGLVSLGMFVGLSLMPTKPVDRASGKLFAWVWIGVIGLVFVLLTLALIDWLANRAYALRHRRALIEERRAVLEAEVRRRRAGSSNGQSAPGDPIGP